MSERLEPGKFARNFLPFLTQKTMVFLNSTSGGRERSSRTLDMQREKEKKVTDPEYQRE